jgi:hypothetical protein
MKSLLAAARCIPRELLCSFVHHLPDLERFWVRFMAFLQLCGGLGFVL